MRITLLASLVGLLLLSGCEREASQVEDQAIRPAKLYRVNPVQNDAHHSFVGRVTAPQTIDIAFEVKGKLKELPVLESQVVSEGELLAELDPTDYRLAVERSEVELRLARQNLERKKSLRDKGMIAESILDEARGEYDLVQLQLQQAREDLLETRIVAPFDAMVTRRFVDNQTAVKENTNILRIINISEIFVVANIPESMVATVTGDRISAMWAEFSFIDGKKFPLTYREHAAEADPVAQTYSVSFAMDRPDVGNILPGMTAELHLQINMSDNADLFKVPVNALLSDAEGSFFVWVVDTDSYAINKRKVSVGLPDEDKVIVTSGLQDGELIVAAGALNLQAGMKVRPLNNPETSL
ncbi:MAG: efflux RND transporter periplasmic adaptor subunit [Pseudomonadales bacterium]|nr:efflux RND transporter periplasmic adaptor subunit [Pseudomonadales bacterium]MCP5172089.1 efflux RND transporter periplasmic adaptor subunit [Pseudomonadales bacterium]